MCMAEHGYIESQPEQIRRIYNEWDFDGESLRAATGAQFSPMGMIGMSIYVEILHLKMKGDSSVRTHAEDQLSKANPC